MSSVGSNTQKWAVAEAERRTPNTLSCGWLQRCATAHPLSTAQPLLHQTLLVAAHSPCLPHSLCVGALLFLQRL